MIFNYPRWFTGVEPVLALFVLVGIPGAIGFDWRNELQDQVKRDFLSPEEFGKLMGSRGISNDHAVVLYGDRNNWFAAYTYWYFLYYGHDNVKLVNGPRDKWISEGRDTETGTPDYPAATFEATTGAESLSPLDTHEIAGARWGTLAELGGPIRERLLGTGRALWRYRVALHDAADAAIRA